MSGSRLEGILLVDKPAGWTSHDVVAKARRIAGQRRIGHTGTLDPAATGLLVLCLGRATRLVEFMIGHGKSYTGMITLGVRTDTDDAEGKTLSRSPLPHLDPARLRAIEGKFSGAIAQRPPAYSAIKVEGERAYRAARRGDAASLAERTVRVDRLVLSRASEDRLAIEVDCGPGTYVRALARDIGEELGCGAHLSALRRTRAGRFAIEEALSMQEVELLAEAGLLGEALIPADEGIADLPAVLLRDDTSAALGHGNPVQLEPASPAHDNLRVYTASGDFAGLASAVRSGELRPRKMFIGG